ncbi:hypothetical protein COLO4_37681 [Corchorus olitorius]|uniref:Uncharacterized protein n=1 Tax=Corchorus olitorius TaxID=93759 RepID=A0A1R3G026_9ROSI|nr:hypothetical protein COLO4_37681 [Corchorus olitorius]
MLEQQSHELNFVHVTLCDDDVWRGVILATIGWVFGSDIFELEIKWASRLCLSACKSDHRSRPMVDESSN